LGPVGVAAFVWWVIVASAVIGFSLWWRKQLLRSRNARVFECGGLFYVSIFGLALAYEIPGAAYLFVWPALAAVAMRVLDRRGLAALAAVTVPTLVLALPVLDVFFQFAQPRPGNPGSQIPEIILLYGFVLTLLTLLIAPWWERARVT
jgi:hypothetical protein